MNTNRIYSPADIKELLGGLVLVKQNFSNLYNEETFDNVARGLLDVMLRMSIQITDSYNVVINGLSSNVDTRSLVGPTQLALAFDKNSGIEQAIEVTEEDHNTIQDAVTIVETVPSDNRFTDPEKMRLVNKIKRGRAMDLKDVVARYMIDKPSIIGQELLEFIEKDTGVGNAFNGLRRTAASIAICRYPIDQATGLPLRSNAKYPGYVDAQNYIISNFKFVDDLNNDKMKRMFANSVLQASLKTYAPELIERVRTSREERTRKKYEEKGYPA